jgi:2-methylcitrate dehydratase PrpD
LSGYSHLTHLALGQNKETPMSQPILDFIHDLSFSDIPAASCKMAELCVLDLIGVGICGSSLPSSEIIRNHAALMFGSSDPTAKMMFDGRSASPVGIALAGGMTIDAFDGHDGYNEAKGHVGCGVFPAALALANATGLTDGQEFLTDIVIGYELGSRLALALHASVTDYHTSGAWVAVACAAIGARRLGLDREATRHAMGIAEYHGPRSQMMRVIDHPSMLKDGSGWGAMAGVSAAFLAQSGFSGAPAITAEGADVATYWQDLGDRWLIEDQYFKPYPVCRWAQAPIEAVLTLKRQHHVTADLVDHIEIASFHEAIRLATSDPQVTDDAQYSTSYSCAVALVRGKLGLDEVSPAAFQDPEVKRLSQGLVMREDDYCNANFPSGRMAKAELHMKDGSILRSDVVSARWGPDAPATEAELRLKFHSFADPLIGDARSREIETAVGDLQNGSSVSALSELICCAN